jgi:hypothetical protein
MSRQSVSFGYLRYLTANDRNRAESNDSLTSLALLPGSLCTKAGRGQYAGLLSVTSLFGRWSRSFKHLFKSTGSILPDGSYKTSVRPNCHVTKDEPWAQEAPCAVTPSTRPSASLLPNATTTTLRWARLSAAFAYRRSGVPPGDRRQRRSGDESQQDNLECELSACEREKLA